VLSSVSLGSDQMTVTLREVTKEDLPIFFEHRWMPRRRGCGVPQPRPRRLMAHWARIMSKETNETGILNTILADDTVAGNVVYWEAAGSRISPTGSARHIGGRELLVRALAQFLTKIEARPVFAHVASTISLRYVSYKNADSNLRERICPMMAKNLLWSCAQIVRHGRQ